MIRTVSETDLDSAAERLGVLDAATLACAELCSELWWMYEEDYRILTDVGDCSWSPPEGPAPGMMACEVAFKWECKGRRPLNCVGRPIGGRLARDAALEAVSVHAFEELAGQLRRAGAPDGLIVACRRAEDDERRHARWLGALAAVADQPPTRIAAAPSADASLLEVATHNAVEGCVNETFAALLALHQAAAAPDGRVRRVFLQIALDEVRHGELAWDVHRWLMTQLDRRSRRRVMRAQREALTRLEHLAPPPPISGLGDPDDRAFRVLARHLARGLRDGAGESSTGWGTEGHRPSHR
jgi:rubrerythrin